MPRILYGMEERGVSGSLDHLEEIETIYRTEAEDFAEICVNIAANRGYDLSLPKSGANSSLLDFCFGPLALPVLGETKTGRPSFDKACLEKYGDLLELGSVQHTFIDALTYKRRRDTQLNYLKGYRRYFSPKFDTGSGYFVLHPSLNQTGTATLRMSSSNPNEQNIGKDEGETGGHSLRYCFGPLPGREWWSLDAKNIELRIPAYESGEEALIELFEKPNDPPYYGSNHLLVFHMLWPELWEKAVDEVGWDKAGPHCKKKYASTYYQWVKNGDFSIQYQAQKATADRTYHQDGAFEKVKSLFAKLEALNQHWIKFAEKNGYVETIPDRELGHSKGYPLLCTRTNWGTVMPTIPFNYHIQGTAGQWQRKAMVTVQAQMDQWLSQDGYDGYIVMQIHDELVLDLPKRGSKELLLKELAAEKSGNVRFRLTNLYRIRTVQRLMEKGGEAIGVPTPVGCEYHEDNWSEGVTC